MTLSIHPERLFAMPPAGEREWPSSLPWFLMLFREVCLQAAYKRAYSDPSDTSESELQALFAHAAARGFGVRLFSDSSDSSDSFEAWVDPETTSLETNQSDAVFFDRILHQAAACFRTPEVLLQVLCEYLMHFAEGAQFQTRETYRWDVLYAVLRDLLDCALPEEENETKPSVMRCFKRSAEGNEQEWDVAFLKERFQVQLGKAGIFLKKPTIEPSMEAEPSARQGIDTGELDAAEVPQAEAFAEDLSEDAATYYLMSPNEFLILNYRQQRQVLEAVQTHSCFSLEQLILFESPVLWGVLEYSLIHPGFLGWLEHFVPGNENFQGTTHWVQRLTAPQESLQGVSIPEYLVQVEAHALLKQLAHIAQEKGCLLALLQTPTSVWDTSPSTLSFRKEDKASLFRLILRNDDAKALRHVCEPLPLEDFQKLLTQACSQNWSDLSAWLVACKRDAPETLRAMWELAEEKGCLLNVLQAPVPRASETWGEWGTRYMQVLWKREQIPPVSQKTTFEQSLLCVSKDNSGELMGMLEACSRDDIKALWDKLSDKAQCIFIEKALSSDSIILASRVLQAFKACDLPEKKALLGALFQRCDVNSIQARLYNYYLACLEEGVGPKAPSSLFTEEELFASWSDESPLTLMEVLLALGDANVLTAVLDFLPLSTPEEKTHFLLKPQGHENASTLAVALHLKKRETIDALSTYVGGNLFSIATALSEDDAQRTYLADLIADSALVCEDSAAFLLPSQDNEDNRYAALLRPIELGGVSHFALAMDVGETRQLAALLPHGVSYWEDSQEKYVNFLNTPAQEGNVSHAAYAITHKKLLVLQHLLHSVTITEPQESLLNAPIRPGGYSLLAHAMVQDEDVYWKALMGLSAFQNGVIRGRLLQAPIQEDGMSHFAWACRQKVNLSELLQPLNYFEQLDLLHTGSPGQPHTHFIELLCQGTPEQVGDLYALISCQATGAFQQLLAREEDELLRNSNIKAENALACYEMLVAEREGNDKYQRKVHSFGNLEFRLWFTHSRESKRKAFNQLKDIVDSELPSQEKWQRIRKLRRWGIFSAAGQGRLGVVTKRMEAKYRPEQLPSFWDTWSLRSESSRSTDNTVQPGTHSSMRRN